MLEAVLRDGVRELGLELTEKMLGQLRDYYGLLALANKDTNLTAITDEEDAARLHFLDSLAVLPYLREYGARSIADIGTGAGFPGLPLAVCAPELEVTLIDAREKRVEFLSKTVDFLGLSNVKCVFGRAEELANTHRAAFDAVVSRAVAELRTLCELCMPFAREDGVFLALKSVNSDDEIRGAENAIKTLGGELEAVRDYIIPGSSIPRRCVIIRQKILAPPNYPRRFARIKKQPL